MGAVAFVAVVLVGRLGMEGRERGLMVGSVLVGAAAVSILLVRMDVAMLVIALIIRGMGEAFYDVPMFTLRQRRTDPAWLGRAFAVSMSLNFAGYPIGSAIGGSLVAVSPELALSVALGFWLVAAASLWYFVPRR